MDIDPRAQRVLDFWFGGTCEDPERIPDRLEFWFGSEEDGAAIGRLDREITDRFAGLVAAASRRELDDWADQPPSRLALILLIDQFRRNVHRGTAAAFSHDARALELTLSGLANAMAASLEPIERAFFLMPLQHAEDLAVQERSVCEYERLIAALPANLHEAFTGFAKYAVLHRDIVARFGRFPHRNAALGRPSTAEEEAYLAGDAPRFGQG